MTGQELVDAPAADVLTGVQLAEPGRCRCGECGRELHDGHLAVVRAHRLSSEERWTVPRVYCPDCAPDEIEHPTRGAEECVARAWLGALAVAAGQATRLTLTNVDLLAYSPASQGYCR